MSKTRIGITISNQFFDFQNIEEPIQTFLDFEADGYVSPSFQYFSEFNVRRHDYKLNDNLFTSNPSKTGVFYSVAPKRSFNFVGGINNTVYFHAEFKLDSRIDVYERTLRNSIDVLGDIGGIFEIIHLLLLFPISYINSKLFEFEISNRLSRFDKLLDQNDKEV
jgi:hypothetical protein